MSSKPHRRAAADVVDDGGSLSFISLSKYGALEDEDEVSARVSQHIADKAEQRSRRKEEQRRRKQEEEEAVAVKPAVAVRPVRSAPARQNSNKKHKRVREEAKDISAADNSVTQPADDTNQAVDNSAHSTPDPPIPAAVAPPPPLPPLPSPLPPPRPLSRFTVSGTKLVSNSDGSYTLRLYAGECITFHGSVEMRVEYGYVRCNNHTLSPSSPHQPHQLHSPAWHPTALLSIEHYTPPHRHSTRAAAATAATATSDNEAVITLSPSTSQHRLPNTPLDSATTYLPIHIPSFHPILQQHSTSPHTRQSTLSALTVPAEWTQYLRSHVSTGGSSSGGRVQSVVLCGNRNVGKSTFGRLVVNGWLNGVRRVLWLDVDVGQSECTPPSLLSLSLLSAPLLSPPHCHLALPASSSSSSPSTAAAAPQLLLSYHIGDVSYAHDPAGYLHCVSLLWQRVEAERRARSGELLPVIVNTAGWIKGAGGIVLAELIAAIKPQHVVYIGDQHADDIPAITALSTLHVLPRHTTTPNAALGGNTVAASGALSADKGRTLSLLSYFLQRSAPPVSFMTAASLLSALRPYRIPFSAVALQLLPPNERLPHSSYLRAFNATIVALCTSDATVSTATTTDISTTHSVDGVSIVTASSLAPLPCVGLGIVRAIDVSHRHLYVLSPLSVDVMRTVRVLVRGSMELPSVLVYSRERDGRGQPYMPNSALTAANGGSTVGGRKSIARKRLAAG